MGAVFLIRHGAPQSSWGEAEADPDPGLNAVGREQAMRVAEAFLNGDFGTVPKQIVSSPLKRCRETAAPLAKALGLSVEIDLRLSEIPSPRDLSGEARSAWLRHAFEGRWDEISGEINYQTWADEVASAVAERSETALFTHFVAINAAVAAARDDRRVRQFDPGHASVTRLRVVRGAPARLELEGLGDSNVTKVL